LKKIAILGSIVVLLGCSGATVADDSGSSFIIQNKRPAQSILDNMSYRAVDLLAGSLQVEQESDQKKIEKAQQEVLRQNGLRISAKIDELYTHVDKTRYVFSGSTPRGWDCSGMTRWFYLELGVELEHSAYKQGREGGRHVLTPKIGDIVAFSHMSSRKYYHVGVYVGNNEIIHAGFKPGRVTEVISLDSPAFKNSEITFVRVIEN
jgi:cell wall-associated NlpC family hydrolase